MKIYECDWCRENKPCKQMTIGVKKYDICDACEKEITLKLAGRGEPTQKDLKEIFGNGQHWNPAYTPLNPVQPLSIGKPIPPRNGEPWCGNYGNHGWKG